MSDREKKLVLLFGLAAFVILNVFGFSWFKKQRDKVSRQLVDAKGKVELAVVTADNFETVIGEMEWMAEKGPEPKAGQLVASELEQFAASQATTRQLTIKRRAIKPNDESGLHFHRAKVELNVNGRESSFYSWIDTLQVPDQFRAVTSMRIAPDAKDDTQIDATIEVEQWYIPQGESDEVVPDEEPEAIDP